VSGHRQAALALHALSEYDRQAILAELPSTDQTTLRGYLQELTALGFQGGEWEPPATPAAATLEAASPAAVYWVLAHEPAALVAEVMALQAWPWRTELLALYPGAQRELMAACAGAAAAPARAAFLRQELEARLARQAPQAGAGGGSTRKWWHAWRR
jgi:hypothetical protein